MSGRGLVCHDPDRITLVAAYPDALSLSTTSLGFAALDTRGLRALVAGAGLTIPRAGSAAGLASFVTSADLARAFSSLFCSRKRATSRSSFASCSSSSALFIFGAAGAAFRDTTERVGDVAAFKGMTDLRFFDPSGRPIFGLDDAVAVLRAVGLIVFLVAARAIVLCSIMFHHMSSCG